VTQSPLTENHNVVQSFSPGLAAWRPTLGNCPRLQPPRCPAHAGRRAVHQNERSYSLGGWAIRKLMQLMASLGRPLQAFAGNFFVVAVRKDCIAENTIFAKRTQFAKCISSYEPTENGKLSAIFAQKTNPKRTQFSKLSILASHLQIVNQTTPGSSITKSPFTPSSVACNPTGIVALLCTCPKGNPLTTGTPSGSSRSFSTSSTVW
jgi:hypothetical protein